MIGLTDIDHVGIAVRRPRGVRRRLPARCSASSPSHRERVEDQGVEEVLFAVGTSYVQLLGALGPDTPVGRFLASRGPGLHHVAYRVRDIEAALTALARRRAPA